jgi:hypothetical protein
MDDEQTIAEMDAADLGTGAARQPDLGKSALERIRERYTQGSANETVDLDVPGYEGDVAVRYRVLPFEKARELEIAATREPQSNPYRELRVMMDELIHACDCILVRVEGGDRVPLTEGGDREHVVRPGGPTARGPVGRAPDRRGRDGEPGADPRARAAHGPGALQRLSVVAPEPRAPGGLGGIARQPEFYSAVQVAAAGGGVGDALRYLEASPQDQALMDALAEAALERIESERAWAFHYAMTGKKD